MQQHYDAAFCTTLCVSLSGNISIPAVLGKEQKVKHLWARRGPLYSACCSWSQTLNPTPQDSRKKKKKRVEWKCLVQRIHPIRENGTTWKNHKKLPKGSFHWGLFPCEHTQNLQLTAFLQICKNIRGRIWLAPHPALIAELFLSRAKTFLFFSWLLHFQKLFNMTDSAGIV